MKEISEEDLRSLITFVRIRSPHAVLVFVAKSPEEFIEGVEATLEYAIDQIESTKRARWVEDTENELRDRLLPHLRDGMLDVTPEEYTNGHIDFSIKHHARPFRYLGECKKWRGPAYHQKGMAQLLKRYASGRHGRTCCLEFVVDPDMYGKMRSVRETLDADLPLSQKGKAEAHAFIKEAFVTAHDHSSGTDVQILHMGCNLYVDPGAP